MWIDVAGAGRHPWIWERFRLWVWEDCGVSMKQP